MSLRCGMVGLPNVGKSTLFNALTKSKLAEIANYPFCTIEPNVAIVNVFDERLKALVEIEKSATVIYANIEFVDIAGLLKGASKGEGLGNKFLSHIKEVDAIMFVIRCFEDDEITYVGQAIDPKDEIEILEMELILCDISLLEKYLASKKLRQNKDLINEIEIIKEALTILANGALLYKNISIEKIEVLKKFNLLTVKPYFYICNVKEEDTSGNKYTEIVKQIASKKNTEAIIISAKIEEEMVDLAEEEKTELQNMLNIKENGLNQVIRCSYNILDLITFFTVGPKEARCWPIKKNTLAHYAAGNIHSDLQKGFICAEVVSYEEFIASGGWQNTKSAGKIRQEGKNYIVQDGDILYIKFNINTRIQSK